MLRNRLEDSKNKTSQRISLRNLSGVKKEQPNPLAKPNLVMSVALAKQAMKLTLW